jgi:hypothetical protein
MLPLHSEDVPLAVIDGLECGAGAWTVHSLLFDPSDLSTWQWMLGDGFGLVLTLILAKW